MAYRKPEIKILGDAASIIQGGIKMPHGAFDPLDGMPDLFPAYDLDE
jgi:hypothetical protein